MDTYTKTYTFFLHPNLPIFHVSPGRQEAHAGASVQPAKPAWTQGPLPGWPAGGAGAPQLAAPMAPGSRRAQPDPQVGEEGTQE